jgi:hypothetical protein
MPTNAAKNASGEVVDQRQGLFKDISEETYHNDWKEPLSATDIKLIDAGFTPASVQYFKRNPVPSTDAQKLGSAIHCALFEPKKFAKRYFVRRHDGRTQLGKAELEQAKDYSEDYILRVNQLETVERVIESIRSRPFVQELLSSVTDTEASGRWLERSEDIKGHPNWVIPAKCRLDAIIAKAVANATLDLKTVSFQSFGDYGWIDTYIAKSRIYIQEAWYRRFLRAIDHPAAETFYFILVSTKAPYECMALELGEAWQRLGELAVDTACRKWHLCLQARAFPGPEALRVSNTPPKWLYDKTYAFPVEGFE